MIKKLPQRERAKQLNTLIDHELPEEARRAAVEVEQALKKAKEGWDEADTRRREAELCRGQLERQHEERLKWEEKQCQADRQRHLYRILANLMGRDGLQLHLLRRAERGIVDLATEILDGLSRGRMRLELRGEDGQSEATSNKALDLVVYDHDTGPRPIPVALASGSQRFRIAVSLALAIGRYTGQEARRIESVIIDEGFGSLDRNGRDDMIQEINELKQQLRRIILVSHQEEFVGAFPNEYAIELIDGASRASLLEQM